MAINENEYNNFLNIIRDLPEATSINVILGSVIKDGRRLDFDDIDFYRLNISTDLAREFQTRLELFLDKYQTFDADNLLEIISYNPGLKPDPNQVEFLKLDEDLALNVRKTIDQLPRTSQVLNFVRGDNEFMKNLRFYLLEFSFNNNNNPIYAFYYYSKMEELRYGKDIFARFTDDQFQSFRDIVYPFTSKLTAIYRSDTIFSLSKYEFERIFDYGYLVQQFVQEIVSEINNLVPIENLTQLQNDLSNNQNYLRKIISVSRKAYYRNISIGTVKATINQFDLQIDIIERNGRELVKYDQDNKKQFVYLMSDSYLQSILTQMNYEVNSKTEMN